MHSVENGGQPQPRTPHGIFWELAALLVTEQFAGSQICVLTVCIRVLALHCLNKGIQYLCYIFTISFWTDTSIFHSTILGLQLSLTLFKAFPRGVHELFKSSRSGKQR